MHKNGTNIKQTQKSWIVKIGEQKWQSHWGNIVHCLKMHNIKPILHQWRVLCKYYFKMTEHLPANLQCNFRNLLSKQLLILKLKLFLNPRWSSSSRSAYLQTYILICPHTISHKTIGNSFMRLALEKNERKIYLLHKFLWLP